MPMIMASAVIMIGRRRVLPASITACIGVRLSSRARSSLAKLTIRIEFRSEEHTSELQSLRHLVCRLLLEKKKKKKKLTDTKYQNILHPIKSLIPTVFTTRTTTQK